MFAVLLVCDLGVLFFYALASPTVAYTDVVTATHLETNEGISDTTDYSETTIIEDNSNNKQSDLNRKDKTSENLTNSKETASIKETTTNITETAMETTTASTIKKTTENNEKITTSKSDAVEETSVYTYTKLNKTLYATTNVNVRSGPDKSYKSIGKLSCGDTVKVTGKCNETKWYRIDYKGKVGYCSSQYLSKTNPIKEATTETTTVNYNKSGINATKYGYGEYIGVLTIPSVDIKVKVYHNGSSDTATQNIVNASNSACLLTTFSPVVIADHVKQSFSTLSKVSVGDYMYIDTGTNIYRYKCSKCGTGSCAGETYMTDGDGNILTKNGKGDGKTIIAYTCVKWPTISYAVFKAK